MSSSQFKLYTTRTKLPLQHSQPFFSFLYKQEMCLRINIPIKDFKLYSLVENVISNKSN